MLQGKIVSDVEVFGDLLVRSKYEQPFMGVGARASHGFTSGGMIGASVETNIINKFAYSGGNASDHGDLSVNREYNTGVSSISRGYSCGGRNSITVSTIDKFNFTSNSTASGHGDMTQQKMMMYGEYTLSKGYLACGKNGGTSYTTIESFEFPIENIASNLGDLSQKRGNVFGGISSSSRGYCPAGYDNGIWLSSIEYYEFNNPSIVANHGNLIETTYNQTAGGSESQGFVAGGVRYTNRIDRFDYSSNVTSSDHANLFSNVAQPVMTLSRDSGYICGGNTGPSAYTFRNYIQKFEFSSGATATDHGDLTIAMRYHAGHQG